MIATATWQYIILRWPSGGVYRVKKRTDGPPPVSDNGTDIVNHDSWSSNPAPPSIMYSGDNYIFAFWSITAQDMLSPQREAHLEFVKKAGSSHPGDAAAGGGMWIVSAKAYYVKDIGAGPGNHGVFIDAFDIQAGDFIADDFVDVTPDDGGKTLTAKANDGYIDTTADIAAGQSLKITARNSLPSGKLFLYWQDVPSLLISANPATPAMVGAPGDHDIVAHQNDIIYAFAFYNETAPTFSILRYPWIYDPWWWIKTHGGLTPGGPPGPEPWLSQYSVALTLADLSTKVSSRLRSAILKIALDQLSITAATIKKEIKNKGK